MNHQSKIVMSAGKTIAETAGVVFTPLLLANINVLIGTVTGFLGVVYMFFKMRNEIHEWNKKRNGNPDS